MPCIEAYYRPQMQRVVRENAPIEMLKQICEAQKKIIAIVAEELSSNDQGGSLTPDDVEFRHREASQHDTSVFDLELTIDAISYPLRSTNLWQRTRQIKNRVDPLLPIGCRFSVWVRLHQACWLEGSGQTVHYEG